MSVNLDRREKQSPELKKNKKHYVYLNDDVWDCLKRHAYEKKVAPARLVRDILTAWASCYTDWDNKTFVDGITKLNFIPLPSEPSHNYLAKLGFVEPTDE